MIGLSGPNSPMRQLIDKLRALIVGSAAAAINLRKRLTEARPDAAESRLEALERAMEIQVTLNETVDAEIKLVHSLLEKGQKRLQVVIVALIAVGTLAVLALAAAFMK
jgi:membrane glycosyltransferase